MNSSKNTSVPFHDFRLGSAINIPRYAPHPLSEQMDAILTASFQNQALVPLDDSGLRIYADLSAISSGNGFIMIDTGVWMGSGSVAAGTLLASVAIACQQMTAPLAWRGILNRYLSYTASAPFGHRLGAPSIMPKTMPWFCGFSSLGHDRLTPTEQTALCSLIHASALCLLSKCEDGVSMALKRGERLTIDPTQFPELLEWES